MRKTKLYQSCHASRPRSCRRSHRRRGITSACAEQTAANTSPHSSTTDHLRVCGADSSGVVRSRDHLRVCGADARVHQRQHGQVGSPPRVRSRRQGAGQCDPRRGITSACAEQTDQATGDRRPYGDHLRVCGADSDKFDVSVDALGSPPRVWSRRAALRDVPADTGITSACAEQTSAGFRRSGRCWDHLRVCGADTNAATANMPGRGLPPRVRSRRRSPRKVHVSMGITSACAEQTIGRSPPVTFTWDYLRVCGADSVEGRQNQAGMGLPPRVRSRRYPPCSGAQRRGITSACAEQTVYPPA